jgi:dihydrofolate reductase
MIISIIAAMDENRIIGRGNRLPWRLLADLKRFRALTMGHPLIMGRKTHESIGRPLSGRTNIVITRQEGYRAEGCVVVHDIPSALAACEDAGEAFVLGGETIFRDFMAIADRIYLTIVRATVEGDARFPDIPDDFVEVSREPAQDILPLVFVVYERKSRKS